MKGLAAASSSFAKVHITGRSARKHYGLKVNEKFDKSKHDATRKSVS